MDLEDRKKVAKLRAATGIRLHLEEWEHITTFHLRDDAVMMQVETFDVQVTSREDRYNRHGTRSLVIMPGSRGWFIDVDLTLWDESFQPYVYEKVGRRQTADELIDQREWEKMCYRPGSNRVQLDSYDRVTDPIIRSTDKMERYW